jgi:hypothetical protein
MSQFVKNIFIFYALFCKCPISLGQLLRNDNGSVAKHVNNIIQEQSQVNIVFIISGSKDVSRYYSSIKIGIDSAVYRLKANIGSNKLKFGAVVYKDNADGGGILEVKKLTANSTEVTSFINQVSHSLGDKVCHDYMFQGIEKGLKDCGMKKGHSNFILLIGDAGSHLRDRRSPTEKYLIKLISDYKCNLVAIQVNNGYDGAFDDFIYQSQTIIKGAAQEIAKSYGGNPNLCTFKSDGNNKHELDKLEGEVVDIPYMVGSFIFPTKGSSMPVQTLENEIEQKIIEFDNRVVEVKNILENSTKNIAGSGFTSNIKFILRKSGLTENEIMKIYPPKPLPCFRK